MTAPVFRSVCQHTGDVAPNPVPDELVTLRDRLRQLESQVAAVRDLHQPALPTGRYPGGPLYSPCGHCFAGWPCATIAALDGVQTQAGEQ